MLNKIICINVLFFFIPISIVLTSPTTIEDLRTLFGLSPNIKLTLSQPWSIITHMFFHLDVFHLMFNIIFLYIFGKIFLKFLSNTKLLSTYIMGGISGGVCFLIYSNIIGVNFENINLPLIGCSSSVLSILSAAIIFTPNYSFKFYENLNFSIKLKFIVFVFILYTIVNPILNQNIGGSIAHIGGLVYGCLYIFLIKREVNLGIIIEKIFHLTSNLIERKTNEKIKNEDDYEYNTRKKIEELELNKILDKISNSGYQSLSKKEKEMLKKHSEN